MIRLKFTNPIWHHSGWLRLQAVFSGIGVAVILLTLAGRFYSYTIATFMVGLFLIAMGSGWMLLEQRRLAEERAFALATERAKAWAALVASGKAVLWLLKVGYTIHRDEEGLYLTSPDGSQDFEAEQFDGLTEADLNQVYLVESHNKQMSKRN